MPISDRLRFGLWRVAASREDAQIDTISLYQHAKRPEWGLAIAVEYHLDRRTFLFRSGERRTIMNEYAHLISVVEPEEDAAADARQYFQKHAARVTRATPVKKAATKRKAPAAKKAKAPSGA